MAAAKERVEWIDRRPRMKSAYLEEYVAEAEAIGEFLDRPEVDERLEAAFFKLTDERLQMIVSNGTNWV